MKTKFSCTRYLLHWPIRKLVNWGQSFLSKALLVTCEVAMEYMLALTYSPQVNVIPWLPEFCLHVWLHQLHMTGSAILKPPLPPPPLQYCFSHLSQLTGWLLQFIPPPGAPGPLPCPPSPKLCRAI